MEEIKITRKDWRDSLVTKIVAYSLTAGLAYGSIELYSYSNKKFCEGSGWLKTQSIEVQKKYAKKAFDESPLRESMRTFHERTFLSGLEKCK